MKEKKDLTDLLILSFFFSLSLSSISPPGPPSPESLPLSHSLLFFFILSLLFVPLFGFPSRFLFFSLFLVFLFCFFSSHSCRSNYYFTIAIYFSSRELEFKIQTSNVTLKIISNFRFYFSIFHFSYSIFQFPFSIFVFISNHLVISIFIHVKFDLHLSIKSSGLRSSCEFEFKIEC